MRRFLQPALVAAVLVLLAGCAAGLPGDPTKAPSSTDGPAADSTGSVAFYLSDQPNAIADFEHLNVTVTQVGFHPTGADNETAGVNGSPTATPTVVGTDNQTMTATAAAEDDERMDGWVLHDVDNRTVDLTRLVGDNATQIAGVELPAGQYNGVFVWVSAVNGTLTDGTHAEVKLLSHRLRLNTHFTVEENTSVDFVFDIAVRETGTGGYVLRPVISESGTDVPINSVDDGAPPVNETGAAEAGPDDPGNGSQGQGQGQDA